MNRIALSSAALAAVLVMLLPAMPAQAQNAQSFVSSSIGSDANPCTRAAPCQSIGVAVMSTVDSGEVNCLDSGPVFGAATITKSITIDCGGATVFGSGSPPLVVNGAAIVVILRNMTITGFGSSAILSTANSFIGIDFVNGAALIIENCSIQNFNNASGNVIPAGIKFEPSAPGSQLIVTDTVIANNGQNGCCTSIGGGLLVAPRAGGSAGVVLNRVRFGFNVTAMVLNSASGPIGAVMTDSVVTSSRSNGMLSIAGQGTNFAIEHSKLVNNVGAAIQSQGANSLVFITDSTITGNQTGVSVVSGGVVQSLKDNRIFGNGSDGTPLAAFPGPGGTPLQ